jgi:hypothetical protein
MNNHENDSKESCGVRFKTQPHILSDFSSKAAGVYHAELGHRVEFVPAKNGK